MIAAVAQRIEEACGGFHAVRGTAALALLTPGADRAIAPVAYVHPVGDRAGPNALLRAVDQKLDRRIGVLISLAVSGQDRGEDATDPLDLLTAELRAALIGWQPDPAATPMELEGGTLQRVGDGSLWWLDTYRTNTRLRAV